MELCKHGVVYVLSLSSPNAVLQDSLRTGLGNMGCHIGAFDFPFGSSHSKIGEAIGCAVSQMIIFVPRILKNLVEVPG